jgi:hypothetical protein
MSKAQERIWVYIAHLETRNFDFRSVGTTEKEAIAAMRSALETHGKQYGCAPKWWKEFGEVTVTQLAFGVGTRDGEIISDLHGDMHETKAPLIEFVEVS